MTDLAPPPRVRAAVPVELPSPSPRARIRPVPHAETTGETLISPRPRERVPVERVIIPDALPIPLMARTHNGYVPLGQEQPDIRFAPMVIICNPEWLKRIPDYVRTAVDLALGYEPDHDWATVPAVHSVFLYEHGLRFYTKKALLSDEVYYAMIGWLIENLDKLNDPARSMLKLGKVRDNGEQELNIDMTTSTGPFHMDSIIAIERHYATRCRAWAPVVA